MQAMITFPNDNFPTLLLQLIQNKTNSNKIIVKL